MDGSIISRRQVLLFSALACSSGFARILPKGHGTRALDEFGFVSIGGIQQWIAIRGTNSANPAILFLHGGPANAESPFLGEFVPWEKEFTVVNWDQRGSGRTYGKNGPGDPGMETSAAALERLIADAIEVAEYASRRLAKKKLILVGHSWGAILGSYVARRRPDLFQAFCATGFPLSWKQSLTNTESLARREALAARDDFTLNALDEAASMPFDDLRRMQASAKYRMGQDDLSYLKTQDDFTKSSNPADKKDAADWVAGSAFSVPRIMPIVFSFDARSLGMNFPLPIILIQGRDDHVAFLADARKYVSELHAPGKALVAIEGGHFACFTNAREFVAALRLNTRRNI